MKGLIALGFLGLLMLSCTSTAQTRAGAGTPLPDDKLLLVREACFEVVAQKPVEESVTYSKPLNWDLVDFSIRNDKYVPLGTAFAISATELVTAAHVLDLTPGSHIYTTRFIRDRKGKGSGGDAQVFEIADVHAFSRDRDYVVFTVKGRTFDSWLDISNDVEMNSKIYTAGDAYGEGIVVREGVLLDQTPEPENGAWHYLKSSTATNPGNSGGPLLNRNGEVIGIALSRKDDFCYSLPMKEIVPGKALVHQKDTLGFTVFDKRNRETLDQAWDLPMAYRDLAEKYAAAYQSYYVKGMDKLLAENEQDMFPRGPNSERALNEVVDGALPQAYLQDTTSRFWFSTDLKYDSTDLGDSGFIYSAELYKDVGIYLLSVKNPTTTTVQELWADPKKAMDLLLKGINITRKLTQADQGSRVLSFGKPVQTIAFSDRFGRPWQLNVFFIEYADEFVMTCATPTPQGLSMLYVTRDSWQKDAWLYDVRKLVDYLNISYKGTLKEWTAFLKQDTFTVPALKALSVSYTDGESADIDIGVLSTHIRQGLLKITKDSNLVLVYSVFTKDGKPVWDVRKMTIDTDRANTDNYYTFYRWVEPPTSLPDEMKDGWKKFVLKRGHPYDEKTFSEDGNSFIAMLHPHFVSGDKVDVSRHWAVTLAVGKEGTASDEELKRYIYEFARETRIKE